jgi:hypothetical protein
MTVLLKLAAFTLVIIVTFMLLQCSVLPSQVSQQALDDVLIILDSRISHADEANFERLAEYYGLTAKTIDLKQTHLSASLLQHSDGTAYKGIYIHSGTLESLQDQDLAALAEIARQGSSIYIDAFGIPSSTTPRLQRLTMSAVQGIRKHQESVKEWTIAATLPAFSRQFTGKVIPSAKNSQYDWQILSNPALASQVDVLVTATDYAGQVYPVVVRYHLGQGNLFIDAGQHDRLVGDGPQGTPLRLLYTAKYFSAVAPIMMFFNFVFGDAIWHRDQVYANLTIDDAELRNPYGYLDYEKLLDQMRRYRFHTTIAFIPVNYEVSEATVAEVFRTNPEFYSLVVHGDNHDNAECQQTLTAEEWEMRLLEGLTRMHEHERRTGLAWSHVMVFPCGIAKVDIFPLLKKYNFIATVNGQDRPLGSSASPSWDFEMRPVDLVYDNVPTLRRLPVQSTSQSVSNVALAAVFNAFIGRPIALYSHHDLFAQGIEAFNPIAQAINSLIPEVQWRSLGETLEHAYLWKRNRDGSVSVMMFEHLALLENPDVSATLYRIQKPELKNVPIQAVEVNGRNVPFAIKDGMLQLELELPARGQARVQIFYGQGDIDFSLSTVTYDQRRNNLSVRVCNSGSDGAPAIVSVNDDNPESQGETLLSSMVWLGPHACDSLGVSLVLLEPGMHKLYLKVDPYDEQIEHNEDNNTTSSSIEVVNSESVIVDDFEYADSPLQHGWEITGGHGKIETIYDSEVNSRVLSTTSSEGTKFAFTYPVGRNLRIPRPHLSVQIKPLEPFTLYVRVRADDGKDYYLQYMAGEGKLQVLKTADGTLYLLYYLDKMPPAWQLLERNLQQDLHQLTGINFKYVRWFVIRGGSLLLDDLILKE